MSDELVIPEHGSLVNRGGDDGEMLAMRKIDRLLREMETDMQARVLAWIASKYGVK